MNITTIPKKSWGMLWQYRALWLLGAIFALFSVNIVYPIGWLGDEDDKPWTRIQLTDTVNIKVPGVDMTIEFTAPNGVRITAPDTVGWRSFSEMVDALNRDLALNFWPVLFECGVILAGAIVLGSIMRYVVETALMRMVDETHQTGRRLTLREGLRLGWSRRAWRLFLLDFSIFLLAAVYSSVVFGLAAIPVLLAIGSHDAVIIGAGIGTFGLLVLAGSLWLGTALVLSFVLQPIRRACALEEQSLWTSIRQGVRLTTRHFKEVSLLWLNWMGVRLLWAMLGTLVVLLLTPALVVTMLGGLVAGGLPAILAAGVAHLFWSGTTPWLMGALAGLPVFLVVMISPILFVRGFVEIYKSCIWTLVYRELKTIELPDRAPALQAQGLTAYEPGD